MVEAVAGAVVGGVVNKALSGGSSAASAAEGAEGMFKPYNVNSNLGRVTFDKKSKNVNVQPSEQIAEMLNTYAGEANADVNTTAANLFEKMNALAADDEDFTRRRTRETLFSSGRLGTSGGIREIGEVEKALANARLNRELSSYETAFNMRQGAFQNYALLSQIPSTVMGPLSLNRNPAAAQVAGGMINAGLMNDIGNQSLANSISKQVSAPIGNWVGDQIGSIFSTPSSTSYTPYTGGYTDTPYSLSGMDFF